MYLNLYQAVKKDDIQAFSSFVVKNENICFGRFPLLTLCYLYKSKKILKKYKEVLLNIKSYKVVEEYYQIYKDFKAVAGRCLRLYNQENSIVQPIEILAILSKDKMVKKLFKLLTISPNIVDKIKKIYYINGKDFSKNNKKIKITQALMSKRQTKQHKIALILSLCCTVLLSCVLIVFNFVSGFGVSLSPSKIFSQNQLYSALNSNGNYTLQNDIILNDCFSINQFNGSLNGNNHTIYLSSNIDNFFIKSNLGNIKNLNLVYKDVQKQTSSSFSLFVNENLGSLNNINISCSSLNLTCNKVEQEEIYVSALANLNKGDIKNCNILVNANINTTQNGECFVGAIAGKNYGSILNCSTLQNSNISTKEADACGIVAYNDASANVENCKNNAVITQTSNTLGWSPNISGIVLTNYGKIKNCHNLASLSAFSTIEDETASGNVFLGGITCMNYGVIEHCLNKADLNASSKKLLIYCGGISAFCDITSSTNISPAIKNCGVAASINTTTEGDKTISIVGGIAGFMYGELSNNYSLATFSQSYNQTKNFMGLSLGSAYTDGFYIILSASKNVVLAQEQSNYQIACLIYNKSIVPSGQNAAANQIETLATAEQIMAHEVYWNE